GLLGGVDGFLGIGFVLEIEGGEPILDLLVLLLGHLASGHRTGNALIANGILDRRGFSNEAVQRLGVGFEALALVRVGLGRDDDFDGLCVALGQLLGLHRAADRRVADLVLHRRERGERRLGTGLVAGRLAGLVIHAAGFLGAVVGLGQGGIRLCAAALR